MTLRRAPKGRTRQPGVPTPGSRMTLRRAPKGRHKAARGANPGITNEMEAWGLPARPPSRGQ